MLSEYLRVLTKRPHNRLFRFFSNLHTDRGTLVAIGHNEGKTVTSFRIYNQKFNVILFEQNPFLERQVKAMGWIAGRDFQFHMNRLGKRQTTETLFLPKVGNKRVIAAATKDRETLHISKNSVGKPGGTDLYHDRTLEDIDEVVVTTQILDSFRLTADIIAFSPDHFEFDALEGMKTTIERCQPIFLLPNLLPTIFDAHEFLESRKYRPYAYNPDDNSVEPFTSKCEDEYVFYVHMHMFETTEKLRL